MDSKFLDAHESLESHGVSTMVSASLVQVVLCLRDQGLGLKQISRELKVSRNTVRRFSRLGHWEPYKRTNRSGQLSDLGPWLEAEFIKHHGNWSAPIWYTSGYIRDPAFIVAYSVGAL